MKNCLDKTDHYKDINKKAITAQQKTKAKVLIAQLKQLKSYKISNAELATDQEFPVIIFQPGFGYSTRDYENFITNLVANGYIVVGIDSYFNSNIQLDERILTNHQSGDIISLFSARSNLYLSQQDLYFTVEHLSDLQEQNNNQLFTQMNLDHIGGLGHSIGAYSLYCVIILKRPSVRI